MGGYGSGRWHWHTKKTTVEDCRSLDVRTLLREGFLKPENVLSGLIVSWHRGKRLSSRIGMDIDTADIDQAFCRLYYTASSGRNYDYQIRLITTVPNFGGIRWWFICPLCEETRCAKLYMPPGKPYFGCRPCHYLTYRSSQESDQRVRKLRKLPIDLLWEGMANGAIGPLLGLKAMSDGF